ncbi:zeta toxin family protein [Paenibacillus arenilitoris]|uniref:UDP-N-acetylglucosamine kinase n=1 Tax=Paenibacillus arenilitoris TaxID=2772299 RepID=A0A927CJR1_9BACL|nr:zeta toxin family protein [Paenibacillus arenilitoris]MBD2867997.1 zeta toxin family protein [Paenibacillus arenilitoris]
MTQRSTKQLNADNQGRYRDERQMLHRNIAERILRGTESQDSPEVIFMGGGTAVGKSTVRKLYIKSYANNGGIAVIDCDDIKELIPEFAELKKVNVNTAASLVHEESGDIAMLALQLALNERMHIVFDATMKDADWYEELIGNVKEKGYATIAVVVHAPLHIALEREALRAEKTERVVPREEIVRSHRMVRESFIKLKDLFDAYVLWDNSKPNFGIPTEIEVFFPGMAESTVHDWVKFADFYSYKE